MSHTSFSAKLSPRARLLAVVALSAGVAAFGFVTLERVIAPDVSARLTHARALLAQARSTGTVPFEGVAAKWTVPNVDQVKAQKIIFIAHILPLIAQENQRIMEQRKVLERAPSPAQIHALARAYGLNAGTATVQQLRARVDVVPASLVLAQAALESAWGTSRFAQEGHAYFGERTYDKNAPGIVPLRASGFKVKRFDNAALSVRSYLRTLNSNRAYRAFRTHRAQLRAQGKPLSGLALVPYLHSYSEIGSDYIDRVTATIRANDLEVFNTVKVAEN